MFKVPNWASCQSSKSFWFRIRDVQPSYICTHIRICMCILYGYAYYTYMHTYNFHKHKELSRNQRMKTLFFFKWKRTQFIGSRGSIKTQPYCAEQTERASFVGVTLAAACPQRRHCDRHSCSRALKFIGGFHFFPNWHVTSVENAFKMCLQMCQATYWPGAVVSFCRDHLE